VAEGVQRRVIISRICGFWVIWEPIIWEYREWSCGVVPRQVLCVVVAFSWAGVCAAIGAGAGLVKGLKEQAVWRWGGTGGVVIGEKEQAVEGRVVWCYMSGWDS